ncbi:MAG: glycosyltransferase [Desulfuromonadaceae bacterium]|nr:glycosyltransferase [Desulfuromonadaceae bacterium]MDD5104833.1 glycosyltransferase [Desulfuromonadaceae bacterium]
MKILHIIDSGGLYGAEVMLLNLISEQVALGHIPILASIGDPGIPEKPLEAECKRRGFNVAVFRMKPGPNLIGALDILRFARAEQVDILHSHGYKGNILFGFLPRFVRCFPMISTLHGWTWSGGMTRMRVYEWLDSLSLSRVDRVVTVSSAMQNHPRLKNRRDLALEVVPNGIPLDERNISQNFPPPFQGEGRGGDGFRKEADLNPEIIAFCRSGFTIGAIGRLSPEKAFDALLEVVAALSAQGTDIRLVILGEGGLRASHEAAVSKLGIEKNVLMPGYIPDAKRYLPFFNLFAMPSLTEGLPMVLLEAMLAGVPIIATRVGGIPEVLQEGSCGLLINPDCREELERGITNVMHNPEAAGERVKAAKLRVTDTYSSRVMAEKYLAIYQSVLQ